MVEFVAIPVILIFTALPARSADQPLATARAPHDAIDARRPLSLLPVMAVHQKQTMREHLGAVQEIIAALGSDDFDAVQRSATRLGFSEEVGQMCEHLGAASPAFTKEALAFHHTADRIATAARASESAGLRRSDDSITCEQECPVQRDTSEALEPGGKLGFSRAINWKSSARNQFRGSVKAVRASGVTADVVLDEHIRVSARNRLAGVVTAVISGDCGQ